MKKLFILTTLFALGFGGLAQADFLSGPPVIKKSSYKNSVLTFNTKSGTKKTPKMTIYIPVKNKRKAVLRSDADLCNKLAAPNCAFKIDLNAFISCKATNCPTVKDIKRTVNSGQKFYVKLTDKSANGDVVGKNYRYQFKKGSLDGVVKSSFWVSSKDYGPWLR